jgi:N-hydroxyarylamine O-acetyltransferase
MTATDSIEHGPAFPVAPTRPGGPVSQWIPLYEVDLVGHHPRDVEVAYHFTSTHPSSPFVGRAMAMRLQGGTRTRLTDRRLQVARSDDSVIRRVLTDEDLPRVLPDVGIELDEGELRQLLYALPLELPRH